MERGRLVKRLPTSSDITRNLIAGLTVSVVALPLALAFGIGSGLGAQAGLVTAVIAGILSAIFGGSRFQVSGPTGAMTVILIPVVATYGPSAVLQIGLIASGFLFLAAALRLGRHIHKLPESLIEGFTAGIAIIIALQQVAFVLGVPLEKSIHIWEAVPIEVQHWLDDPKVVPISVGVSVLVVNLILAKIYPKLPTALLSVIIATFVVEIFNFPTERIGELPPGLGSISFEFLSQGNWVLLILPAMAVAFLAGLEGLVSAKIADRLAGSKDHNPNRELFGQAIGNLVVPFFGGVPSTAALARTAVNVKSGATSRLAAVSHGIYLLAFVFVFANLIERIPLAALGGVLIATAFHMIKFRDLLATARASKLDGLVLMATLIATVTLDLISSLLIGLLLFLLLRRTKLSKKDIASDEDQTLGD